MSYTNNLVLDLNAQPNGVYIYSKEGDSLSRFLNVTILRDGVKYTPTDSVMFRAEKPDGHAVITAGTVEDDGTVTIELTAQTLAVAGRILCDVALVDGEDIVSTATFTIIANHMPNVADQAESSDEFGYIIEMLNDFKAAVETSVDEYVAEYSGGFATKVELESVQDTVTEQSAVIAQQKLVNDRQNKQIDTLYKILDGQELDFDTQTQTAYELPIGSAKGKVMGASALDMLGGMSQVIDGDIRTAQTSEIVSKGANLWDEQWEFGVFDATTGVPKSGSGIRTKNLINTNGYSRLYTTREIWLYEYDENENIITDIGTASYPNIYNLNPSNYVDLKPNCKYVKFYAPSYTDAYKFDISISYKKGEYTPYREPISLPIPQDCPVLHGINDSVYDYVDIEKTKFSNMKSVDLGDLVWNASASGYVGCLASSNLTDAVLPTAGTVKANAIANILCVDTQASVYNKLIPNAFAIATDGNIRVYYPDMGSISASAVKEYLRGIVIHYEAISGGEDYEAVLLHKRVGVVDLGSLNWTWGGNGLASSSSISAKKSFGEIICGEYPLGNPWSGDKVIFSGETNVTLKDSQYTSLSDFVNGMQGILVYYELATEQILDVTDIFAEFDNLIEVEDGGTLAFKNSEENEAEGIHIPVPSTVTYPVRLGV